MKRCSKCKESKELSEFSRDRTKSDGYYSSCKICLHKVNQAYRDKSKAKIALKNKQYSLAHPERIRKASREWYQRNRDLAKERRKYIPEVAKRNNQERYLMNPEKIKARVAVYHAVKKGKLIKPSNCSNCTLSTKLQAHHPDYEKRLDVEWLCGNCHGLRHRKDGVLSLQSN